MFSPQVVLTDSDQLGLARIYTYEQKFALTKIQEKQFEEVLLLLLLPLLLLLLQLLLQLLLLFQLRLLLLLLPLILKLLLHRFSSSSYSCYCSIS